MAKEDPHTEWIDKYLPTIFPVLNERMVENELEIKQAKILNTNAVFVAARGGTVRQFESALSKFPPRSPHDVIQDRGAYNETLLHIACLFGNVSVMRYICKSCPELIKEPYKKFSDTKLVNPYEGETPLHICIVHADFKSVRFLVSRWKKFHGDLDVIINEPCVTGTFFKPPSQGGTIYMGGHLLTFAACIENIDTAKKITRFLAESGANFHNQDHEGNTVLHIMVLKDNAEMFNYIMDLYELYNPNPPTLSLEHIINKKNQSPLSLASALAKGEIFEAILRRRKQTLWIFGPVGEFAYPLKDVDTYRDEAPNGNHSVGFAERLKESRKATALELVLALDDLPDDDTTIDHEERAKFLTKTPIKELIEEKWSDFGRTLFNLHLGFYLIYLALFSISVAQPTSFMNEDGSKSLFMKVVDSLVLVCVLFTIYIEALDWYSLGKRYFSEKGSQFFFSMTWINGFLVIMANFFRLHGDKVSEDIFLALASIVSYFYILYFARGDKTLGYFVVSIREILLRDLIRFLVIYLIVIGGFSLAFMVMFRGTGQEGFISWENSFLSMFHLTLMNTDDFELEESNSYAFTLLIQVSFIIIVSILMLNMLIAMMGNTYTELSEKSEILHVIEWVSIVLTLERRMPIWLKKRLRSGKSATKFGLSGQDYYLVVRESIPWGDSSGKGNGFLAFKNAARRCLTIVKIAKIVQELAVEKRLREEKQTKARPLEEIFAAFHRAAKKALTIIRLRKAIKENHIQRKKEKEKEKENKNKNVALRDRIKRVLPFVVERNEADNHQARLTDPKKHIFHDYYIKKFGQAPQESVTRTESVESTKLRSGHSLKEFQPTTQANAEVASQEIVKEVTQEIVQEEGTQQTAQETKSQEGNEESDESESDESEVGTPGN